jgi:hypothetical protein
VAFNRAVRQDDEWWDEPDELERWNERWPESTTSTIQSGPPVFVAYRIARAQASVKATSALPRYWRAGCWIENGWTAVSPPNDWTLADLLVKAASGPDVEADVVDLLIARR